MANSVILRAATRKRGNPNWGSGRRPPPAAPGLLTEFEEAARRLRLTRETWASSLELREWCVRNKNRVWVPEWLLAEWRILVESDDTAA